MIKLLYQFNIPIKSIKSNINSLLWPEKNRFKIIRLLFFLIICYFLTQNLFNENPNVNYNFYKTPKQNILWGGAMQLAWNQLKKNYNGQKPLTFNINETNTLAKQTIDNFNYGLFSKNDINQKDVYVKSGKGPKTVDIINKQISQKFPQKSLSLDIQLQDSTIISYAFLFKNLKFQPKFKINQDKNFKFNGKQVQSFYAKTQSQFNSIKVHKYVDRDNFIVQIKQEYQNDSIFLIKGLQISSVKDAINLTQTFKQNQGSELTKNDKFQMPVVKLRIERSYSQMHNLQIFLQNQTDYILTKSIQQFVLQINEGGVKLENTGLLQSVCLIGYKYKQPPKQIILDKQFWIVMKQQEKHPYFCGKIVQPIEVMDF